MTAKHTPTQVVPGDDLHLIVLMSPMSLNLVTGQDRESLLAYARSVWQSARRQALIDAATECESKHANGNYKYDTRHECANAIEGLMK